MQTRAAIFVALFFMTLGVVIAQAQQSDKSPPCNTIYQHENQIDSRALVVQHVSGRVTFQDGEPMEKACAAIFTEEKKLVATAVSDATGKFAFEGLQPGIYRLVVTFNGLCAANAGIKVVKHKWNAKALHVQMKARGLDDCSYIERDRSK